MATTTDEKRDAVVGPTPRDADRQLVDVLTAVLVDPNLHTDTRMRLHGQLEEILRAAYEDVHQAPLRAAELRPRPAGPDYLAGLLTAVLVDPDLHTDQRVRLHHQLTEALGRLSSLPAPEC